MVGPMADLDATVRGLLRDIGAAVRPLGFRGSGGAWRLVTPHGVAVIEKQGARGSTGAETMFYVNTAVAPTIWWQWRTGSTGGMDRARETDGIRLLEGRVPWTDPAHGDQRVQDRWRVTAGTDLDHLRADLLPAVDRAARRLVDLLTPGRYRAELHALPEKQVGHWHALVVLLAADGTRPELDDACARLRAAFADRPHAAGHVERVVEWARSR